MSFWDNNSHLRQNSFICNYVLEHNHENYIIVRQKELDGCSEIWMTLYSETSQLLWPLRQKRTIYRETKKLDCYLKLESRQNCDMWGHPYTTWTI